MDLAVDAGFWPPAWVKVGHPGAVRKTLTLSNRSERDFFATHQSAAF
jgi:hypothetical protein